MNVTRVTSRAGAAAVAVIAAIVSYQHMRVLAATHGQDPVLAALIPASVDGLMMVAAVAMADDRHAGQRPRLSARLSFVTGVIVSVAANTIAAPPTLTARLISAWPAIALLLVVEMLARGAHQVHHVEPAGPVEQPVQAVVVNSRADNKVDKLSTPRKAAPTAKERVERAHRRTPQASHADLAARLDLSPRTVARHRPVEHVNGRVPDLEQTPVSS